MPTTPCGQVDLVPTLLAEAQDLLRTGVRAMGRQAASDAVGACPLADETIRAVRQQLEQQLEQVGRHLETRRPARTNRLKRRASPALHVSRASSAIQADQAVVQQLALIYLELQSASQAAGDGETAALAAAGYEACQSLIRERISRAQSPVAAADLAQPSSCPPGVVHEPSTAQRVRSSQCSESGAGAGP